MPQPRTALLRPAEPHRLLRPAESHRLLRPAEPHRLLRPAATAAALTCLALVAPGGAAPAQAAGRLDPAISTSLSTTANSSVLGPHLSGVVLDGSTGRTVWARNTGTPRRPASTQKLMTAFTVLHSMDADTELVTRTYQSRTNPSDVFLRGAGDPTLTPERLRSLARRTAADLKAQGRTRVNLYRDASVYPAPSMATGWKSSYIADKEVQAVRPLTLAGYRGSDGTLAAAQLFRTYLGQSGVTVADFGRGTTPEARDELEGSWSRPVGSMVQHMLRVSDNDEAEALLRVAALHNGIRPTWSASLAHQRRVLGEHGIPLSGYRAHDGSGLSRSDRMPVRTLAATVERLYSDPATRAVVFAPEGMPRSGQTGTLRSRYRSVPSQRCAVGRVMAKTGTLSDTVGLAGVAQGTDGRRRVFVFLQNGSTGTAATRRAVDQLATGTVGCRL